MPADEMIEIVDDLGEVRYLMPPDNQLMRGTPPRVFGDDDPSQMIPRDQWDKQTPAGLTQWVPDAYDQNGIGECNASATGYILEYVRAKMGLQRIKLSAGDLYRRICGGVDRGSMLQDAIEEVSRVGMCRESTCPYLEWRRKMPGAEAEYKDFRVPEWEWAPTTEHLFSAAFKGHGINIGIMWGEGDKPDDKGWLPDAPRGRVGGHAIFRCVPAWDPSRGFGLAGPNSWSPRWGAAFNGRPGWMIVSEKRLKAQERQNFGWFVCRTAVYSHPVAELPTPQD